MRLTDKEVGRLMSEAARRATAACVAAGYGLSDKVTKDSAFAAADEVHRLHRPEDYQAAPVAHRVVSDPRSERMEREPGEPVEDRAANSD